MTTELSTQSLEDRTVRVDPRMIAILVRMFHVEQILFPEMEVRDGLIPRLSLSL